MKAMAPTTSTSTMVLNALLPAVQPAQLATVSLVLPSSSGELRVCGEQPGMGAMIAYALLRASIVQWTKLPDDWDGRGGSPLNSDVASAASAVLGALETAGLPVPTPLIAGDGEVAFKWETDRGFGSVSLLADMSVLGYVRPLSAPAYSLDAPFMQGMNLADLIQALRPVS